MDFRWFRFGGVSRPTSFVPSNSSSSSSSSGAYGYFTEQALRDSLLDARGDLGRFGFVPPLPPTAPLMPPMLPLAPMAALRREIEKQQIREEVMREIEQRKILEEEVMRQIEQRKILEEEVRREIEMEQQLLALRREISQQGMSFAPSGDGAGVNKESMKDLAVSLSGASLTGKPPADDQKLQLCCKTNTEEEEEEEDKPILSSQRIQERSKSLSSFSEVLPLNKSIIGTKRKAVADAGTNKQPSQIPKDWSCALCQVSSTSEEALNDHLQGKRHKTKAAALVAGTTGPKVGGKACGKPYISASSNPDDGANSTVKTVNIQLDGKLHKVQDRAGFLWCDLCDVKVNSTILMASHLGGRKHAAVTRNLEKKQTAKGATHEPEVKEDERSLTTESVTK